MYKPNAKMKQMLKVSDRISTLLALHVSKSIEPLEAEELNKWVNESPTRKSFFEKINDPVYRQQQRIIYKRADSVDMWARVQKLIKKR